MDGGHQLRDFRRLGTMGRDGHGEVASGDAARDRARRADRLGDEAAESLRQPEQGADSDGRDEQGPQPDGPLRAAGRGECGGERLAIEHPPLARGHTDDQLGPTQL